MQTETLPLEIRVILGKIELSASLYQGLRVGDILILEHPIEAPLPLEVEKKPIAKATIGLLGEKKAAKIESIHE